MQFVDGSSFHIDFETRDVDGARYFLPDYARHRPAGKCILNGRYYEPQTHKLVAMLLQAFPGNMVHAGTFFGDMLPSFSRSCGEGGTLYAFEPLLENYVFARLAVDYNELGNVVLFNSGLGERLGPCRIARGVASGTHSGGASKISDAGDVTSSLVTVDSLGLTQLSILQLDVEGFELSALTGAKATIMAHRPAVMIEDNNRNCESFLSSLGYTLNGTIPGLSLWSSRDRDDLGKLLTDFAAKG